MSDKPKTDPWNFRKRLSLATRVGRNIMALKTNRTTINEITPSDWMSVLQPLAPFIPVVDGWQWNRPVGWNIFYTPKPRGNERYDFNQLRAMAMNCEMLRLVIETRKDQMSALNWQIKPRDEKKMRDYDDDEGVIAITSFFQSPDKRHDFDEWLRLLLEELFVTDAVSVLRQKSRGGKLHGLELVDGTTIFPLLDEGGRRPFPPDPAYQQILFSVPKANFTTDELIYKPRNMRINTPYGYSQTEQVMMMCRMQLERGMSQLAYFTDGTVPDSYATLPKEMTEDQIKSFNEHFNNLLSGNLGERRKMLTGPEGMVIEPLKPPLLKDEFDEWIARIICFAFSMSPTPFVKQMNRAQAESEKERATAEGLGPTMIWVKRLFDKFIREDFNRPDLEFSWLDDTEQDPQVSSTIAKDKVSTAQWTINEARDKDGLEPIEGGDEPLVLTAMGYVPLTAYDDKMEMAQQMQDAAAEAGNSDPNQPGKQGKPSSKDGKTPKSGSESGKTSDKKPASAKKDASSDDNGAYSRLGKAVSHPAIPFPRPETDTAIAQLAALIAPILKDTGNSVAAEIRGKAHKMAKEDGDDPDTRANDLVATIRLDHLDDLTRVTPQHLLEVMAETGTQTIAQIGFRDRGGLVNQVYDRAVTYSNDRAAEMVGKKWVDGVLVDNPNAEWVITDSTRNELRSIIAQGLENNIGMDAIADQIIASTGFSEARAELIAATEIAKANSMGALAGYKIAVENGVRVKKLWKTDEDPCPICILNGDQGAIELDELFHSADQCPPAHPNCECVLQPVVVEPEDESG